MCKVEMKILWDEVIWVLVVLFAMAVSLVAAEGGLSRSEKMCFLVEGVIPAGVGLFAARIPLVEMMGRTFKLVYSTGFPRARLLADRLAVIVLGGGVLLGGAAIVAHLVSDAPAPALWFSGAANVFFFSSLSMLGSAMAKTDSVGYGVALAWAVVGLCLRGALPPWLQPFHILAGRPVSGLATGKLAVAALGAGMAFCTWWVVRRPGWPEE